MAAFFFVKPIKINAHFAVHKEEPRRANASAAALYATQNDYLKFTQTPKSFQLSTLESRPPFSTSKP